MTDTTTPPDLRQVIDDRVLDYLLDKYRRQNCNPLPLFDPSRRVPATSTAVWTPRDDSTEGM